MSLTVRQKSERVLQFLRGVNKARVASALAAHGFTQEELDEGWSLLRGGTGIYQGLPVSPESHPDSCLP